MRGTKQDWPASVGGAARNLALARGRVAQREAELADEIRAALNEGQSPTEIAKIAGISRARVYQIRDWKR